MDELKVTSSFGYNESVASPGKCKAHKVDHELMLGVGFFIVLGLVFGGIACWGDWEPDWEFGMGEIVLSAVDHRQGQVIDRMLFRGDKQYEIRWGGNSDRVSNSKYSTVVTWYKHWELRKTGDTSVYTGR